MPRDKTAAYERIIRMPVSPAWAFPVVFGHGVSSSKWSRRFKLQPYPYVGQPCMGIPRCCHRRYDLVGMDCKYFHEEAQSS